MTINTEQETTQGALNPMFELLLKQMLEAGQQRTTWGAEDAMNAVLAGTFKDLLAKTLEETSSSERTMLLAMLAPALASALAPTVTEAVTCALQAALGDPPTKSGRSSREGAEWREGE